MSVTSQATVAIVTGGATGAGAGETAAGAGAGAGAAADGVTAAGVALTDREAAGGGVGVGAGAVIAVGCACGGVALCGASTNEKTAIRCNTSSLSAFSAFALSGADWSDASLHGSGVLACPSSLCGPGIDPGFGRRHLSP